MSDDLPRYVLDVRPHVPPDIPRDPRLHLVVDGWSACGLGSPRQGTHNPDEADCPACAAALQRGAAGLDAGLVQRVAVEMTHGNLTGAEELARAMHPSAFDDDGHAFAAATRQAQHDAQPAVNVSRESSPPGCPACGAPLDPMPGTVASGWQCQSCGAWGVPEDIDAKPGGGLHPEDVPVPAPRGWDRVEGVPLDQALAEAVRRALAGGLVDMTQEVVSFATDVRCRWWQCRFCGRGRVLWGAAAEARVEHADHEDHCPHNPDHAGRIIDDGDGRD